MGYVKLGNIGEGFIGLTYKPEDVSDEGIIVLRSGNIQNNKIDLKDTVRVKKNINKKLMLKDEDILICSRNGSAKLVGKSAIIEQQHETMTFGAFMMVYRSKNNKYLVHYFNSPYFHRQLISGATTTINQFTKKMLDEITVPLPNIDTQKKIVQVLDAAQSLIDKRKQQIDACDELIKSRFVEMFGDIITNPKRWGYSRLSEVCDITSSKRIFESEYVDEGVPFYRTKEIVELSKGNNISTQLFISSTRYEDILNKYEVPKKNDILISAVGTIGVIWVVDNNEQFYFKDGNLLWIKSNSIFESTYFKYALTDLIDYYKKDISAGSAYSALTIGKLKDMNTFLPPLEIQNQFATFVQQVDKQKLVLQQSLSELEGNFNSLMQRAFKGELFPED
ncbi:restriction endonuclease subunit S [[Clostridium] fimetarium]|uniref:Type I restriction enzyme, S subunit n=1 Tax=[Clostridium] fimetarium TaxID=99656 RepID=A0A1I0RDF4_9FIRM|nr:restriction endonuclease subunit S [[Clostridium] fimetarium]SEW38876.1 type I restriction enzyme, S subunit [[Clostridium] fimetarium]